MEHSCIYMIKHNQKYMHDYESDSYILNMLFVLIEPVPNIYVANIGESIININILMCWVPSNVLFDVQMKFINQIKKQLTENRIEIPLPQQILHITNRTDIS
jgi:small-conductance mechanosensitive channel